MAFYVICDDDSKHESMTKEQILAAIAQAIETGSIGDCDTGFVTKVKELNGGRAVTFWVGTQAQYNALAEKAENCVYIITDDTTGEDLLRAVERMTNEFSNLAASMTPVDLSDDMLLTASPSDGFTCSIESKKYTYLPHSGIMLFMVKLHLVANAVVTNGSVTVSHDKRFWYALEGEFTPCTVLPAGLDAYYYGGGAMTRFCVEGISLEHENATTDIIVSGFYFCNGE